MSLESILNKFGQDIGVGPVSLDNRNACYLRFDQHNIVIEHISQQSRLFIYTSIIELPSIETPELYELLLNANLFGQGTGSAWFARNPNTA